MDIELPNDSLAAFCVVYQSYIDRRIKPDSVPDDQTLFGLEVMGYDMAAALGISVTISLRRMRRRGVECRVFSGPIRIRRKLRVN